MRRREFITLVGCVVALRPDLASGQQPTMSVIGFLNGGSPEGYSDFVTAYRRGLAELGYVEGRNVSIEYRWAMGEYDRLPALAADLVHAQVAVIAATSTPAALAAKSATATIPIVFETASDPIRIGLVARLDRPGGNITGVTQLNVEVLPKRLELLRELVPKANAMAILINPTNAALAQTQSKNMLSAAHALGLDLHFLNASSQRDLDGVFANVIKLGAGGLVISADPLFTSWGQTTRDFGSSPQRARGIWMARVRCGRRAAELRIGRYRRVPVWLVFIPVVYLKGEKPADLAIQQATRVELYVNLTSAKTLGITIPPTILARADAVIE